MQRCCRSCYTARRRGCGAIRRIAGRRMSSTKVRRGRRIVRIGATGINTTSTKWSGPRTGQNPRCDPCRARVWGDEAEIRVREGTLPRTGQERQPTICDLRAGEPVPGAQEADGNSGVVSPNRPKLPNAESDGHKTRGNEGTDLPWGLFPGLMAGVVQRFPSVL